MARLARAGLKVLLGLFLGLVLAELAFRVRDDFAFPHVNFYLPDPELGARLEPNATERLAFTGNPPTTIHTNSRGFRGEEWPAPRDGELIVVGDSQVFGLGVEDAETFPAELARVSGRQVLNAGVPTYGPKEYLSVARALLAERPKAGVVLVFNVANDFFELEHSNVSRHAVWVGWAVRKENLPASGRAFPGRRWLNSQSHLVFAWRKFDLERQRVRGDSEALADFRLPAPGLDEGTASEGSWRDLLTASEKEQTKRTARGDRPAAISDPTAALREKASSEERSIDALDELTTDVAPFSFRGDAFADAVLSKQVGDVVRDTGSEMARSITVTAELLEKAALHKRKLAELRRKAELETAVRAQALKKTYAELERLRWELPVPPAEETLGEALLDELVALGRERDVTLVVLPLDVQVSAEEAVKYGARKKDLRGTLELNRALVGAAQRKGLRAVDVEPALTAAEPGAFLLGDLHLTTKGIAAVAKAVNEAFVQPEAPKLASPLPSPAEWSEVTENLVKGSTAARCETKQVREWLRVRCDRGKTEERYYGIRFIEGRRGEQQLLATEESVSAVLPVRRGERQVVGLLAIDDVQQNATPIERRLVVDWAAVAPSPTLEITAPSRPPAATNWIDRVDRRIKTCEASLAGRASIPWGNWEPRSACFQYPDCLRLLACLQGHPLARPRCEKGWINAGPDGRCLPVCEGDGDCKGVFDWGVSGTCTSWGRQRVCL